MRKKIGLVAIRLEFKQVGSRDLLTFRRNSAFDAFDVVKKYLTAYKGHMLALGLTAPTGTNADDETRALRYKIVHEHPAECVLEGIVEAGEAGEREEIVDLDTSRVTHTKGTSEAMMPPFYFRFFFPNDESEALLILQKHGQRSPRGAVIKHIMQWLNAQNYLVTFDAVCDRSFIDRFLDGGVVTEVLVRTKKHKSDPREMLRQTKLGGQSLEEGTAFEVVLRPKGLGSRIAEQARRVVNDGARLSSVIQLPGLSDFDDAVVNVHHPKHGKRRFDLRHLDESVFTEDVTERVTLDGGHPTWDTIQKQGKRVCDHLSSIIHG